MKYYLHNLHVLKLYRPHAWLLAGYTYTGILSSFTCYYSSLTSFSLSVYFQVNFATLSTGRKKRRKEARSNFPNFLLTFSNSNIFLQRSSAFRERTYHRRRRRTRIRLEWTTSTKKKKKKKKKAEQRKQICIHELVTLYRKRTSYFSWRRCVFVLCSVLPCFQSTLHSERVNKTTKEVSVLCCCSHSIDRFCRCNSIVLLIYLHLKRRRRRRWRVEKLA